MNYAIYFNGSENKTKAVVPYIWSECGKNNKNSLTGSLSIASGDYYMFSVSGRHGYSRSTSTSRSGRKSL